jgi:hypothetical protein
MILAKIHSLQMVIVTTVGLKRMIALNINVGFKKGVNNGSK